jgi:hypothetical protein
VASQGCGPKDNNPETFAVTGTLTYQSKAIEGADIVFVPDSPNALAAFGKTDSNGKYSLRTFKENDGAVPGGYKIKVTKLESLQQKGSDFVAKDSEAEAEIYRPEDGDVVKVPKNLLPKKYSDHNTSGLSHSVANGPSTFDINLK